MIVTFERDIKNELIELEKEVTKILEDSFNNAEPVKPAFTKVLKAISKILYKTSLKHEEWHPKDEIDKQFSFFPGYITNKGDRVFNIAFLKENDKNNTLNLVRKKENGFENFNLDFWFNKSLNNQNFEPISDNVSLLSLAYHYLFKGNNKDVKSDFSQEVGGTHQWASINSDEIAINDFLEPLELLVFYNNKKDARRSQVKNKSWISIPFDLKEQNDIGLIQNEIYDWCVSVVNKLDYPSNKKNVSKSKHKWPYNPKSDYNEDIDTLHYRAYIVAFWMQLVFHPDKFFTNISGYRIVDFHPHSDSANSWFNYSDYILKKTIIKNGRKIKLIIDENLREKIKLRQERINNFRNILVQNKHKILIQKYKYWYTIPFRHRLDFSPKDRTDNFRKETGSAMILSNYLLDSEYFRFIIPWLNQMYDAMREYDTAFEASKDIKEDINKAMKNAEIDQDTIDSINEEINYTAENE